jgi:hypothetical protein
MKKRPMKKRTPEQQARHNGVGEMLRERIAHNEQKLGPRKRD